MILRTVSYSVRWQLGCTTCKLDERKSRAGLARRGAILSFPHLINHPRACTFHCSAPSISATPGGGEFCFADRRNGGRRVARMARLPRASVSLINSAWRSGNAKASAVSRPEGRVGEISLAAGAVRFCRATLINWRDPHSEGSE